MPVFAFSSPKDKNHHVVLRGGEKERRQIENYLKILNRAKWCSGLQMPVLLVLCSLQREQMRHGVTLPCFTCFWVRLCSSCPFCYLRWQGWPCHMGAGPCACLESPCKGCVLLYPCGSVVHVISAFQKETAWFSGFCLMGERGLLCFPQFQGGYSIEKYYKHHCVFTCMSDLCYSGVFLIVLGGKKEKKDFETISLRLKGMRGGKP